MALYVPKHIMCTTSLEMENGRYQDLSSCEKEKNARLHEEEQLNINLQE